MTKLSAVRFALLLLFISGFWTSTVVVVGEDSLHEDMVARTHYNGSSESSNVDYYKLCDTTLGISEVCIDQRCQAQCNLRFPQGSVGYCSTVNQFARCRCRHIC